MGLINTLDFLWKLSASKQYQNLVTLERNSNMKKRSQKQEESFLKTYSLTKYVPLSDFSSAGSHHCLEANQLLARVDLKLPY